MNNHPRGSCVFMCVLLCIGVLIAMGFSQSTALLINEYSSVSQNPLQKLQTRQPPQPPNKNRRAITSNTLLYLLFFIHLFLITLILSNFERYHLLGI